MFGGIVLSLFDIFNRTKRKFIPLAIYPDYEETEDKNDEKIFVNPDEFSEKYFDKIIIMTRRLHEMGIYEEQEIVRFLIPKMLEFLDISKTLSGVSISTFDMVGVVFGKNYAGWLYKGKTKKGEEFFYRVPYQLLFYHSKKENNYFICRTRDGLELKQNKVSVTNKEDKTFIIKNTKNINLSKEDMKELQLAYLALFMYIKQNILIKKERLGYTAFIEKLGNYFFSLSQREEFIGYAKQFFSLSMDREEFFLAYENYNFKDFLYELLRRNAYVIDLSSSYANITDWIEEKTKINIDVKKEFADHFEFLNHISTILSTEGYYLYFLIKEELLHKTHILLSKEKNILESDSKFSYKIISFDDAKDCYDDEVYHERKIRKLAKSFYHVIGVDDIENMMLNIMGNRVLDFELCKKYYLNIFSYDDNIGDISYTLTNILSNYGLYDLIKNASINSANLNKGHFFEWETRCFIDQAMLYADSIRKNGKLLYSLTAGSYSYLGILENDIKTKEKFEEIIKQLLELKEIENYVIFDSEEKEMFIYPLSNVIWTVGGKEFLQDEMREKFYVENAKIMNKEEADMFLSRVVIKKPSVKVHIADYSDSMDYIDEFDEDSTFTISAENGKHFTTLDLLLQIQKHFINIPYFTQSSGNKKYYIADIILSMDRDKYNIYLSD